MPRFILAVTIMNKKWLYESSLETKLEKYSSGTLDM